MQVKEKPLEWVERVERSLLELEERPQFAAPPFPKKIVEEDLSALFQKSVSLTISEKGWREGIEIVDEIPSSSLALKGFLSPINSPLFFSMSRNDLSLLFAILSGSSPEHAFFIEEEYLWGFFQFLSLRIFSKLQKNFTREFSYELESTPFSLKDEIKRENLYLIDVEIQLEDKVFFARVYIPQDFRLGFKERVSRSVTFSDERLAKIPLFLSVEVGSTTISKEEFKKIKIGDFLLIEHPYLDFPQYKGRVHITLHGEPLFRGKVEDEGIRLLSYPIYEEVRSMKDEEEEEEEYSENFPEEEEYSEESKEREKPSIRLDEIPLEIKVELSKIEMSARDLLNLTTGDLLDLKVRAEEGVSLIVNGKKIFRGELVKIEDALFVRILE